jgi:hypothetical protein
MKLKINMKSGLLELLLKSILPVILIPFIIGCRHETQKAATQNVVADSVMGMVVADTIIYDVTITNTDSNDTWTTKRLQNLDHKAMIDYIFDMIYAKKVMVYNHETNERLTPAQVHKLEQNEGFSREHITMVQFSEIWYMNPEQASMTKKVTSMVLGINYYTSDGELFGYEPLFRVELTGESNE